MDTTRALMRWIAGNDLPPRMVIACPSVQIGGLKSSDVVVRLDHCIEQDDAGILAQVLAAGVTSVSIVDHCSLSTTLLQLFPSVTIIESIKPRFRLSFLRPTELKLGEIDLPRRTVLGLRPATILPFDVRADEDDRVLAAFRILKEKGMLGDGGVAGKSLSLDFDGCIACGVCVRSCTYSALSLFNEEGVSHLVYDASACRGELDCVRLCPQAAISVKSVLDWNEIAATKPRVVDSIETRRCERCQAVYPYEDEKFCTTCRALQINGFGQTADVEELKRRAQAYRRAANLSD